MDAKVIPRPVAELTDIAAGFPALLCDIWGVIHNGVAPFTPAVAALSAHREAGGVVVLITNAPRPSGSVAEQLDEIGIDRGAYDDIVSSGDVAREVLTGHRGKRIFHLGPNRDLSLYEDLPIELAPLSEAELVSCTGLFDDEAETASDYDDMFATMLGRGLEMLCANPDLAVERGDRIIPCAGALASRFRALGGTADVVGKPLAPIYDLALPLIGKQAGATIEPRQILAIGDGAATDIVGAQRAGLASLFIASGMRTAGSDANGPEDVAAFLAGHDVMADYVMLNLR
jgi:HAD superfamily hydrolase (TIGR01459 family)